MAKAATPDNGMRTVWIRVLAGTILLIVGGAMTFFFNHTQLDAHPQMRDRAARIESTQSDIRTELGQVQTDVRANRHSLIRIETKLGTSPPIGPEPPP